MFGMYQYKGGKLGGGGRGGAAKQKAEERKWRNYKYNFLNNISIYLKEES
jgi:hypothetical protein